MKNLSFSSPSSQVTRGQPYTRHKHRKFAQEKNKSVYLSPWQHSSDANVWLFNWGEQTTPHSATAVFIWEVFSCSLSSRSLSVAQQTHRTILVVRKGITSGSGGVEELGNKLQVTRSINPLLSTQATSQHLRKHIRQQAPVVSSRDITCTGDSQHHKPKTTG